MPRNMVDKQNRKGQVPGTVKKPYLYEMRAPRTSQYGTAADRLDRSGRTWHETGWRESDANQPIFNASDLRALDPISIELLTQATRASQSWDAASFDQQLGRRSRRMIWGTHPHAEPYYGLHLVTTTRTIHSRTSRRMTSKSVFWAVVVALSVWTAIVGMFAYVAAR